MILNLEKFFKPSIVSEVPFYNDSYSNIYLSKVVICQGVLVGVTNQNKAYYREGNEWIDFPDLTSYKCTVLKTYENLVIFAGYKRISVFKLGNSFVKLMDENVMEGVIRSVLPLEKNTLLICDEQGRCKIISDYSIDNSISIDLPKSKEMWITSAIQLDADVMILSNRMGHLLLYKKEGQGQFLLKDELKRVHGNLGATGIHLVRRFDNISYVRTSGHDNSIRTIKIDGKADKMQIVSKEVIPVSWVERIENG